MYIYQKEKDLINPGTNALIPVIKYPNCNTRYWEKHIFNGNTDDLGSNAESKLEHISQTKFIDRIIILKLIG